MADFLVPAEDGTLMPSSSPAPLDNLSEGERALSLAANTGGSGEGMSHWSLASRCGRRARLSAARYQSFAEQGAQLPATKNHFVIGSVYHKLHELARSKAQDKPTLDYNEQFQNPNVAEGARLYNGWLRHWGLDFWGHCLGVEVHLSDDTTFSAPVHGPLQYLSTAINVTGALDMVVEMDAEACERARARGLDLLPGRRIVDWKSADGPSDGTGYRDGLQALWYTHLWNLHFPDTPVDGIIFDVVLKRSRRKDRTVLPEDFQAFYVPAGMESVETLRGMIMQGHENIAADRPNRSDCVSWRGDVCPFRLNGECDAHEGN